MNIAYKFNNLVSANTLASLDPTKTTFTLATSASNEDTTVITSSCSSLSSIRVRTHKPQAWAIAARALFGPTSHKALNAIKIETLHAIADTGATSIFVMDGIDVANKQVASKPLTVNLPYGRKVYLTHVCNITILGLPTVLTRHITLDLALALLVGIRPLCKVGFWVIFDKDKCDVKFEGTVILRGYKDPSTDL
jgi:hypothetical protein